MTDKIVIITGSGFSNAISREISSKKDLEMPLLSDLTKITLEKFAESPEFKNLKEYVSDLAARLGKSLGGNFEYLLSYLYQSHPWKSEEIANLDYSIFLKLSKCLSELFSDIQSKYSSNSPKWLDTLLQFIHTKRVPVITFNYDTLFERFAVKACPATFAEPFNREIFKGSLRVNFENRFSNNPRTSTNKKVTVELIPLEEINVYVQAQRIDDIGEEDLRNALAEGIENDNNVVREEIMAKFKNFRRNPDQFINSKDLYPFPINHLKKGIDNFFFKSKRDFSIDQASWINQLVLFGNEGVQRRANLAR